MSNMCTLIRLNITTSCLISSRSLSFIDWSRPGGVWRPSQNSHLCYLPRVVPEWGPWCDGTPFTAGEWDPAAGRGFALMAKFPDRMPSCSEMIIVIPFCSGCD